MYGRAGKPPTVGGGGMGVDNWGRNGAEEWGLGRNGGLLGVGEWMLGRNGVRGLLGKEEGVGGMLGKEGHIQEEKPVDVHTHTQTHANTTGV